MSLLIGSLSILISSKTAQQKPWRSEGEQAPITPEKTFGGVPLSKLSELVLVKCFCNTCGSNFRGQHRHANASGTRAIDYALRHPYLAVLSVPERKQSAARQPLQDSLPSGWIPRFKRRFVTIV